MFENISNSFKAKLYDFTYNPFMSSFVISWVLLNHEYVLIYFTEYDLDTKLTLLGMYSFDYVLFDKPIEYSYSLSFPILFGLFYTFAYPYISKIFYKYTLERNKELKKIKQDIIDITPITQEEASELRSFNNELITKNYNLEKQISELSKNSVEKDNEFGKVLKTNVKNVKVDDVVKLVEDDRKKIERFFYESNFNGAYIDDILDSIVTNEKIPRPKAKKIFTKLLNEGILLEDSDNDTIISDYGNDYLINLFDKEINKL